MKKKAPADMVLKGWLIDTVCDIRERIIIDEFGLVFMRGQGWSNLQNTCKVVTLPTPVPRGNDSIDRCWDWKGWWTFNWQCDSWAWCFMHSPQET